jgi:hypothetical protein
VAPIDVMSASYAIMIGSFQSKNPYNAEIKTVDINLNSDYMKVKGRFSVYYNLRSNPENSRLDIMFPMNVKTLNTNGQNDIFNIHFPTTTVSNDDILVPSQNFQQGLAVDWPNTGLYQLGGNVPIFPLCKFDENGISTCCPVTIL